MPTVFRPARRRAPLVGLLLAASACGLPTRGPSSPEEDRVFASNDSELLYLGPGSQVPLCVEVDVVEGFAGADRLIGALQAELERLRGGGKGIEIERGPAIAPHATRGRARAAVALEQMDGCSERDGGTSYLYVLFDDSERSGIQPYNPHVRPEYRCAIFYDEAYVRGAMGGQAERNERLREEVLLHELGHALGLVRNGDHGEWNHCVNDGCRSQEELTRDAQWRWCEDCHADLDLLRARTDAPPLRFHGPMLVRTAADYWVVSLPGYFEVVFVSPFAGDWRATRDRALEQGAGPTLDHVRYQIVFEQPAGFDLESALARVALDPNPLAAEMACQVLDAMSARR